jgi:hypothetical protein
MANADNASLIATNKGLQLLPETFNTNRCFDDSKVDYQHHTLLMKIVWQALQSHMKVYVLEAAVQVKT